MYFGRNNILNRNYQTTTTNRFVVDSPRFWRPENNPRFAQVFTVEDFKNQFTEVNARLPFKLKDEQIEIYSQRIYDKFSGHRISLIPEKNPFAKRMFLADLGFALEDILPNIMISDYPLIDDDFNVVDNRANTGKVDTTKLGTDENNQTTSNDKTNNNMLTRNEQSHQATNDMETVKEENDSNTKTVADVFLSAQNQGVKPVTANTKHGGVDGITLNPDEGFTTNSTNELQGSSDLTNRNTNQSGDTAFNSIIQNDDVLTESANGTSMDQNQYVDITNQKSDDYMEGLHFDRAVKLQQFYDIMSESLWLKLFNRLAQWILQINIATSDTNYLGCKYYE